MTYQTQSGTGGNEVDFGTATQPGYNTAQQSHSRDIFMRRKLSEKFFTNLLTPA